MNQKISEKLGEPAVEILGLKIWVHRRQFPDLYDFWDGNWLLVTIQCRADGASVFTSGSILRVPELSEWRADIERIKETLTGNAELQTLEPYFGVVLKAHSLGHISMEVDINPDHLHQRHWFEFEMDQSYLGPLLMQLRALLEQYPIRGR
jgi:hypothetical protein